LSRRCCRAGADIRPATAAPATVLEVGGRARRQVAAARPGACRGARATHTLAVHFWARRAHEKRTGAERTARALAAPDGHRCAGGPGCAVHHPGCARERMRAMEANGSTPAPTLRHCPPRLFSRALPLPRARSYRHRHRLHRDALSAAPRAAARAPRVLHRCRCSLCAMCFARTRAQRRCVVSPPLYIPPPCRHCAAVRRRCAASKVRAARTEEPLALSVTSALRSCTHGGRCAHLVVRLGLPAAIQRCFSASSAAASVKPLRESSTRVGTHTRRPREQLPRCRSRTHAAPAQRAHVRHTLIACADSLHAHACAHAVHASVMPLTLLACVC
jgi:hypothetical protein